MSGPRASSCAQRRASKASLRARRHHLSTTSLGVRLRARNPLKARPQLDDVTVARRLARDHRQGSEQDRATLVEAVRAAVPHDGRQAAEQRDSGLLRSASVRLSALQVSRPEPGSRHFGPLGPGKTQFGRRRLSFGRASRLRRAPSEQLEPIQGARADHLELLVQQMSFRNWLQHGKLDPEPGPFVGDVAVGNGTIVTG